MTDTLLAHLPNEVLFDFFTVLSRLVVARSWIVTPKPNSLEQAYPLVARPVSLALLPYEQPFFVRLFRGLAFFLGVSLSLSQERAFTYNLPRENLTDFYVFLGTSPAPSTARFHKVRESSAHASLIYSTVGVSSAMTSVQVF